MARWKQDEGSDIDRGLVHPVRALLASGSAGACSLPRRVDSPPPLAPPRDHRKRRLRFDQRNPVSASTPVGMETKRSLSKRSFRVWFSQLEGTPTGKGPGLGMKKPPNFAAATTVPGRR